MSASKYQYDLGRICSIVLTKISFVDFFVHAYNPHVLK